MRLRVKMDSPKALGGISQIREDVIVCGELLEISNGGNWGVTGDM